MEDARVSGKTTRHFELAGRSMDEGSGHLGYNPPRATRSESSPPPQNIIRCIRVRSPVGAFFARVIRVGKVYASMEKVKQLEAE